MVCTIGFVCCGFCLLHAWWCVGVFSTPTYDVQKEEQNREQKTVMMASQSRVQAESVQSTDVSFVLPRGFGKLFGLVWFAQSGKGSTCRFITGCYGKWVLVTSVFFHLPCEFHTRMTPSCFSRLFSFIDWINLGWINIPEDLYLCLLV